MNQNRSILHERLEQISSGTHDRFIIDAEKFNAAVAKKAEKIGQ
ncbi:MAG: hypothetical protein PVH87_16715 [Desulfobacteraceae bacterium]|jgi:predicted thioesterase